MSENKIVFLGIMACPKSLQDLQVMYGYVCVEHGKITKVGTQGEFETLSQAGEFASHKIIQSTWNQFLMPGLVDCHTHAPQFPNIGVGLDRPLLEWLDKYTFPMEKRYKDPEFAAHIYNLVVRRLLNHGTTTACYFGSIHLEGTMELVKSVKKYGQRGLVGKVSMNIKNNSGYYTETAKELADMETFIQNVLSYENDLILPVVTPRFALSCDEELMKGLSNLAAKYGCRIQSHISENREEIESVLKLYSDCRSYADVYYNSGLLNNKTIMAHGVYLTSDEIDLFVKKGVSIAHCPASNTRLRSGLCPVRKLIDRNVTVGLGTDVSGGDSASMLDAMRRAMDVSTHLELIRERDRAITWKEAFYLATLGGAKALNLDDKIGSFEVGKDFDALLIDMYARGSAIDQFISPWTGGGTALQYAEKMVQRFAYLGDDRNIIQVYVKGNRVKNILSF